MDQTNSIGSAMLNDLLWRITDYEAVRLTFEEYKELEKDVLDVDDMELVEREINLFLKKVGYSYNHEDSVWEREEDEKFLDIEERVIHHLNTIVKLWTGDNDYYLFQTNASNEKSSELLNEMRSEVRDYSDRDIIPYFRSKGYEAVEILIPEETIELSW